MKFNQHAFPTKFSFLVVITFAFTLLTPITIPAQATSAPTCATGGTCAIGDIGPGGGKVFYIAPTTFTQQTATGSMCTTNCKYLEAAPRGWNNAGVPADDPLRTWVSDQEQDPGQTNQDMGVPGTRDEIAQTIGYGYKNSELIKNQFGNGLLTSAAVLARAYASVVSGVTYNDWYLPSKDELNKLNINQLSVGAMNSASYWSSSGANGDTSWSQSFSNANNGVQSSSTSNGASLSVRPIRAFAPPAYSNGNGAINCGTSGYIITASYIVTGGSTCVGTAAVPSGVTSISAQAFEGSLVSSISIPATVTTIGAAAFRGATSLATVTFATGSTVSSIGSAAFERTAIATIVLPETLTFLGNYAFWSNSALTSIVIPNGVTQLLLNTFENTTSLTSVTLPNALTLIQADTFKGATSLSTLVIPNTVTSIGSNAFSNTTALTAYSYCGPESNSNLATAGLGSKTKASCAAPIVYVPPTPVPYLKTLTTPKLNLKDGNLICTPGTYNTGYTLDGVVQGSATALFTPSTFTYNLLINGITQISLSVTSPAATATWTLSTSTSGSLLSCSVTVSANGVTNTDKSTDNTSALSSATSTLTTDNANADAAYTMAQSANAKAYQKALVDNRANWRTEIAAIRTNYFDTVARINTQPKSAATNKKMIADKSTALKVYIAAQKKSAADYKASQPAALSAREAANKAALDAKNAAIAKANATYGTFIESIGYGVLIP
jgi:hypothetical protein